MPRPRQFDRHEVLDAALELFWQHGYGATTTRDLESHLGLNSSSLYNAYGSKHGLLDAALDRYQDLLDDELLRPLSATASVDGIVGFFDRLVELVTDCGRRGCLLVGMMAEDTGRDPAMIERTRAYRGRVRRGLRDALARSAAAGDTAADDGDERADLLLTLILGLNIAARGGAARDELDRMLAAVRHQIRRWRI